MKTFTTTGVCIPSENYMVNLDDRIIQIREMVERGEYFTINRARQYGKTTTLNALYNSLLQKYTVLYLSFEGIGDAGFTSEHSFVRAFSRKIKREIRDGLIVPANLGDQIDDFISRTDHKAELDELFDVLYDWCYNSEKEIVLIIDEVDSATNNQVFLGNH